MRLKCQDFNQWLEEYIIIYAVAVAVAVAVVLVQDVVAGETSIINENGETEIIENVLEHPYEGDIYKIETMHSLFNLTITEEHPVLCLSGNEKGLNYDVIKNRINKNIIQNEWKDVKDLCEDDMLVYKTKRSFRNITINI